MTLIKDRFAPDVSPPPIGVDVDFLEGVPAVVDPEPDVVAPRGRRLVALLNARLATPWIALLVAAWVVIYGLGVTLEPPAPATQESPAEAVVISALLISWAGAITGFIQRRRYAALASTVGAVCLVVMTFGCPLSGHHEAIGAWWWFQVVGSLTLLGLSGRALTAR